MLEVGDSKGDGEKGDRGFTWVRIVGFCLLSVLFLL